MKLVSLKCPSCGADLKINSELKQFTCNFCGTTSLLDDETKKVEVTIKNTKADEIKKAIETFIERKEYLKALYKIQELENNYPEETIVYIYKLRVLTKDFSKLSNGDIERIYKRYVNICNDYYNYEKDTNQLSIWKPKLEDYRTYISKKHRWYLVLVVIVIFGIALFVSRFFV